VAKECALRRVVREDWERALARSKQLDTAVRMAAAHRSRSRLRTIIELAVANGKADTLRLPAGASAFKQGDPASSFYVVKQGRVQMSYSTPDGSSVLTKTYGPGDTFGASGVLSTGGVSGGVRRNTATACDDDTTLYVIPHRHLLLLMREDVNAQSSFTNLQSQRKLLSRSRSEMIDKVHLRDEEAFMMNKQSVAAPTEAFEED